MEETSYFKKKYQLYTRVQNVSTVSKIRRTCRIRLNVFFNIDVDDNIPGVPLYWCIIGVEVLIGGYPPANTHG